MSSIAAASTMELGALDASQAPVLLLRRWGGKIAVAGGRLQPVLIICGGFFQILLRVQLGESFSLLESFDLSNYLCLSRFT